MRFRAILAVIALGIGIGSLVGACGSGSDGIADPTSVASTSSSPVSIATTTTPVAMTGLAKAVYDELVSKGRDVVASVSGTETKGIAIRTTLGDMSFPTGRGICNDAAAVAGDAAITVYSKSGVNLARRPRGRQCV